MKKCYFLVMFVLLTACHSTEPDPELVKLFGDHCESHGHERGSAKFNECLIGIGQKK
jgi:hypothetical protein